MKKINIENTVTIIARKSNGIYKLDYYLKEKRGEELYLFTRKYSKDCYRICKSGASINKVISIKSRNIITICWICTKKEELALGKVLILTIKYAKINRV